MEKAEQPIKNTSRPDLEVLKTKFNFEKIDNWDILIEIFGKKYKYQENKDIKSWIFRGEKIHDFPLTTSLERAIDELGEKKKEVLYKDWQNILKFEGAVIREFKRKCHLFVDNPPPNERFVEWLALMQHYGAPTRLLDWTYSFFIAVFFALENLKYGQKCFICAIDSDWLGANNKKFLESRGEKYKDILSDIYDIEKREKKFKEIIDKPINRVFGINPSRLNSRLVIQQGFFLCPGNISKTFIENLEGNLSQTDYQDKIIFYIIPYKAREEILRNLYRMNINRAALFPGLEGFAKSLNLSLFYDLGKYELQSEADHETITYLY